MLPINNKLLDILSAKKKQLEQEKIITPYKELEKAAYEKVIIRDFKSALKKGEKLNIIAEFKKASPSKSTLNLVRTPKEAVQLYEQGGASAVSVLTEKKYFLGDYNDVTEAVDNCNLPILRKDFIIDEYDILRAKVLGASATLLISSILEYKDFKRLYDFSKSLGLDILSEIHSEDDLEKVLSAGADIIGINNRNLSTFVTDIKNTEKLIPLIPKDKVKVAESGIFTKDDALYVRSCGADAALIGSAFSLSDNPKELIEELRV